MAEFPAPAEGIVLTTSSSPHAVYEQWRAREAEFLTPPTERRHELRCYLRDPDGHLIEIGQRIPG